ncbi:hypothetical protein [Flavobacterium agrisoli]|uniref:hypothetical protein n=1 Tax=Flavobacterium agrisoli TaxID=2793066 RepID=UPI00293D2E69|nr:hypothetical protein [Flavobacterium agrisoli]
MKTNNTLLIFVFLITQIIIGQAFHSKEINGQVVADSVSVEAISVVNNTTQQSTVTDVNGFFSIMIKEGDVLVFSAVNLIGLKKRITPEDMALSFLMVKMQANKVELNEVIINQNSSITAESLGIIPYGQKKYTPAERKIRTATSTPIDGLLNAMSGRTKMLKKELVNEKKQRYLYRLETWYSDEYYTERLKIPLDYIKGFQYYCVENTEFIRTLETNNKTMNMFLITQLAQEFLNKIENEN